MHELSIVNGIISHIERQKTEHNFDKVLSVELSCGPYNCISDDNIQFCFNAIAGSSWISGAKVAIKRRPLSGEDCHDNAIYITKLEVLNEDKCDDKSP